MPTSRGFVAFRLSAWGFLAWAASSIAYCQDEADTGVRLALSTTGVDRYAPGKWSTFGVRSENRSDEDREATISVSLGDDKHRQFARRLRIPAGTRRTSWLPIRPPHTMDPEAHALHAFVLKVVHTDSGDVLARGLRDTIVTESLFPVAGLNPQTGTIFDIPEAATDALDPRDDEAIDLIVAGRESALANTVMINLREKVLPPYSQAYDGLDQIVVCGNDALADSAAAAAIRAWLARGGHLWFMIDLVRPETVQAVLGDAIPYEVVDRIELTSFTLNTPSAVGRREEPLELRETERAIEFVRVLADSAEVYATIDDWPASFSVPFGLGEVLFTTLGARGWRYEHYPFADASLATAPTSGETRAFQGIASDFFRPRDTEPIDRTTLDPILGNLIGYEVPSRSLAGILLGANFIAILGAGFWCFRRECLERMAFILPAITVVSAALFVLLGRTNAGSVPASAAIFEFAMVSPGTEELFTSTIASLYSPEAADLPLIHEAFDLAQPGTSENEAPTRTVLDSSQKVRWEGSRVAPGAVRLADGRHITPLATALQARGRFTEQGLVGRVVGANNIQAPSDALIARAPSPAVTTTFVDGNRFVCTEDDVLAVDEFISGSLLSDEQARRQDVYRKLLDPIAAPSYPRLPTLLVWGTRRTTHLSVPDGFQVQGSTLYNIPLTIERTPRGQPFLIPSSFVRIEQGGSRFGSSSVYNVRTARWAEKPTAATDSWFRFGLPREVLPCTVEEATLTVKIHAPSRTVDFCALSEGEKATVESHEDLSQVIDFVLTESAHLQLQDGGDLVLGIRVNATEQQEQRLLRQKNPGAKQLDPVSDAGAPPVKQDDLTYDNSTWQIDYMRLRVKGTTL